MLRRVLPFFFSLGLAVSLLGGAASHSWAVAVADVPNPQETSGAWVVDLASILSPSGEQQLNQLIGELEATNGTEMAIVTVLDTQPSVSPRAFAMELFNRWGLGKAGVDNGLLFLISEGDRRNEIETGYGLKGILPDAKLGQILREQVTPQFKQGNFEAGILAATQTLVELLKNETFESKSPVQQVWQPVQNFFHPFGWSLVGIALFSGGVAWFDTKDERAPQKIAPIARSVDTQHVDQEWIDDFHRLIGPALAERKGLTPVAKVHHQPLSSAGYGVAFTVFATSVASLFIASWFTSVSWFTLGRMILIPELLLVWAWLAWESWQCQALDSDLAAVETFERLLSISIGVLGMLWCIGVEALTMPVIVGLVLGVMGVVVVTGIALGGIASQVAGVSETIAFFGFVPPLFLMAVSPWYISGLANQATVLRGLRRMSDGERLRCEDCEAGMRLMAPAALAQKLRQPEQVAQELESTDYEGWQCPNCSLTDHPGGFNLHLFSWAIDPATYKLCPTCDALTMTEKTETTTAATIEAPGEELITKICACCNLVISETQEIPQLPPPSQSSSS